MDYERPIPPRAWPPRYPLNNSAASRPLRDWSAVKIPIGSTYDRSAEEQVRRRRLNEEVARMRSGHRLKDIVANALSALLNGF